MSLTHSSGIKFQSTRPMRDGTDPTGRTKEGGMNFNPPAPCGTGLRSSWIFSRSMNFNPPAPCGTGLDHVRISSRIFDFNPPAPCGTGREVISNGSGTENFNPPAPCGTGPDQGAAGRYGTGISIHPPHAGRDGRTSCSAPTRTHFNPPAPCGTGRPGRLGLI